MITDEKIKRINQLALKSRTEGLSEEEEAEQRKLRAEYVAAFKSSLVNTLEHTVIERPDGTKEPLSKKGKS